MSIDLQSPIILDIVTISSFTLPLGKLWHKSRFLHPTTPPTNIPQLHRFNSPAFKTHREFLRQSHPQHQTQLPSPKRSIHKQGRHPNYLQPHFLFLKPFRIANPISSPSHNRTAPHIPNLPRFSFFHTVRNLPHSRPFHCESSLPFNVLHQQNHIPHIRKRWLPYSSLLCI